MHYTLIIVQCIQLFLRQISINRDFLHAMSTSVFEICWYVILMKVVINNSEKQRRKVAMLRKMSFTFC